jgi:hypothetical protein
MDLQGEHAVQLAAAISRASPGFETEACPQHEGVRRNLLLRNSNQRAFGSSVEADHFDGFRAVVPAAMPTVDHSVD